MKIAILSAATGGGHLRAAHAVEEYLRANAPEVDVRVIDALKSISPILDKTICDGYHFLATKTPRVFGKLYQKTNEETALSQLVPKFNSLFAQRLWPVLAEFGPDVILTTHPFVTEMVSNLKQRGLRAPLVCIMTDYGPHRSWIAPAVDAYVVSSEDMVPELEYFGVPRGKIYPYGIPVRGVFFRRSDKEGLLRALSLEPALPTVLMMAGSFGVSHIMQIYREITQLPERFQMIVITGRNQKLYEAFQLETPRSPKQTLLVYFTDEVEKYMHASDLIITKPGGLTVSEALACNIPLAVFDAIPGQEEDNANFLLQHEMAVKLAKGGNCGPVIERLLADHEKLRKMRESCEQFDKSDSSKNIFSLINNLLERQKQTEA